MKTNKTLNSDLGKSFFSKNNLFFLLSGLIPLLVFICIYAIKKITPFGNNTILSSDVLGQYVQFYTELANKLQNGDSLLYTWSRGLGQNYLAESAYYTSSPMNFILLYVNKNDIPAVMNLLITFKASLAGVCMYTYIIKHYKKENNNNEHYIMALAFSCCYALSSYILKYNCNIMWLDCVALFPLVILALENLAHNRYKYVYSIVLAISIFSNFYIGYMVCIFCVIYFIYLLVTKNYSGKIINTIIHFFSYSLLAGGICSAILIPTIIHIFINQGTTSGFSSKVVTYYPIYISFFRMMFNAAPTFPSHVYIYFSVIVFFILPLYAFCKPLSKIERISKLSMLLILLTSFQFAVLDYFWNGFHHTNGYSGRYSFIYIFIAITVCIDTFLNTKLIKPNYLFCVILSLFCLFLVVNRNLPYRVTFYCISANIVILVLYTILLVLTYKKNITYFIYFTIILEVIFASYYSIKPIGILLTEYNNKVTNRSNIINQISDSDFYRIKNDYNIYNNEAALLDYKGLANYSSVSNTHLLHFLYSLGYSTSLNTINSISFEPVSLNMLNTKYFITDNDDYLFPSLKTYKSEKGITIYENTDCLSIGYEIPQATLNCKFEGSNPFERINDFARTLDCNLTIYNPVAVSDINTHHFNAESYLFIYSNTLLQEGCFISNENTKENLYQTAINLSIMIEKGYTDNYIYYVHTSPLGGYFDLSKCDKNSEYIIYSLNIDDYNKLMDILKCNQVKLEEYSSTHVRGTIDATYSGAVLTSIPFEKGWTVEVDNKEITPDNTKNTLLAFKIDKGKHTIELNYSPAGYNLGRILTIISLFILLVLFIGENIYIYKNKAIQ